MRDEIDQFQARAVQPFGVNPAGVASHAKYVAKFRFPFPLLSDPDRTVADAFGALKPAGRNIRRSVVLIGRDGRVLFAERGSPSTGRILAVLVE